MRPGKVQAGDGQTRESFSYKRRPAALAEDVVTGYKWPFFVACYRGQDCLSTRAARSMLSFARLLPLLLAGVWASPAIAQPEAHPVPRTAVFDKTFCTLGPKNETPPRIGESHVIYSEGSAVAALPDGGLIAAGSTIGKGPGIKNACVARFDASGTVVWEKTYGGAGISQAHYVAALPDGGFAVAGWHASRDAWIFRLDAEGVLLWERTFGGTFSNHAALMPDGGLAVTGAVGRREEPVRHPSGAMAGLSASAQAAIL